MIDDRVVEIEGRAVADDIVIIDPADAQICIEPVERARFLFLPDIHGARPIAPAVVDLAVVEAIVRELRFGQVYRRD